MKRTNANEIFSKVDAYLLGIIRDKAADYENPATTPGELYQFALDTANLRLFALKRHLVSRWHAYCLLRRQNMINTLEGERMRVKLTPSETELIAWAIDPMYDHWCTEQGAHGRDGITHGVVMPCRKD